MELIQSPVRLLLIMVFFLVFGCEEDNNSLYNVDSINIGSDDFMNINFHHKKLVGERNQPPEMLNIDMDHDGTDDIRFVSEWWGHVATGEHQIATIACLHPDIEFSGVLSMDTTYLNVDTTIRKPGSLYPVDITIATTYSCQRISESYRVLNVKEKFNLLPLHKNDILSINDVFHSGAVSFLESRGYMDFPVHVTFLKDTAIFRPVYHYNICNPGFPNDSVLYIGVRIDQKLGWIKLAVFEKYKIFIASSGLRK